MKRSLRGMLLPPLLSIVMGCAGASVTRAISRKPRRQFSGPIRLPYIRLRLIRKKWELNGVSSRGPTAASHRPAKTKSRPKSPTISLSRYVLTPRRTFSKRAIRRFALPRGTAPTGANVIMVDGEFDNVSEGNRLSRTVIGFGAGSSTLDTSVYVVQRMNGTTQQIMQFMTHADSGQMPGSPGDGSSGCRGGRRRGGGVHGREYDCKRDQGVSVFNGITRENER